MRLHMARIADGGRDVTHQKYAVPVHILLIQKRHEYEATLNWKTRKFRFPFVHRLNYVNSQSQQS